MTDIPVVAASQPLITVSVWQSGADSEGFGGAPGEQLGPSRKRGGPLMEAESFASTLGFFMQAIQAFW